MVLYLRAKKANLPKLGPRYLVKFSRVGKAIEVKCPTYARGSPLLGLNIDRCIITKLLSYHPFEGKELQFSCMHVIVFLWWS